MSQKLRAAEVAPLTPILAEDRISNLMGRTDTRQYQSSTELRSCKRQRRDCAGKQERLTLRKGREGEQQHRIVGKDLECAVPELQ